MMEAERMTEAEWPKCTDPMPMLRLLGDHFSRRKMQLLACAACRHVWHLLADKRSRDAVEVAEDHADRRANKSRLRHAIREARFAGEAFAGAVSVEIKLKERAASAAFCAAVGEFPASLISAAEAAAHRSGAF